MFVSHVHKVPRPLRNVKYAPTIYFVIIDGLIFKILIFIQTNGTADITHLFLYFHMHMTM